MRDREKNRVLLFADKSVSSSPQKKVLSVVALQVGHEKEHGWRYIKYEQCVTKACVTPEWSIAGGGGAVGHW